MSSVLAYYNNSNGEKKEAPLNFLDPFKRGWYNVSIDKQKERVIYFPGEIITYQVQFLKEYNDRSIDSDAKDIRKCSDFIKELIKDAVYHKTANKPRSISEINSNPFVPLSQLIEESGCYCGQSYNSNGTEYRTDGSIVFKDQGQALNYMWRESIEFYVELFMYIFDNSILLLPFYLNWKGLSYQSPYGYTIKRIFKKGNVIKDKATLKVSTSKVSFDKNKLVIKDLEKYPEDLSLNIIATMHTHPNEFGVDNIANPSPEDIKTFSLRTPHKSILIMSTLCKLNDKDRNLQSKWFIRGYIGYRGKYKNKNEFLSTSIQKESNKITVQDVVSEEVDLIELIKNKLNNVLPYFPGAIEIEIPYED